MVNNELESLLNADMEEVVGGTQDTCVCENGGAGAVVIVEQQPPVDPGNDNGFKDV